jgi:hypothetical protein
MLSGEKSHVVKAWSRRIRNHHHLPGKVHRQSKLSTSARSTILAAPVDE